MSIDSLCSSVGDSSKFRTAPARRMALLVLGLVLGLQTQSMASQLTLLPNTSGKYTDDHSSSPRNNTTGLGGISITELGNRQGIGAPREMRSYLIFDTFAADASLVGATLTVGVQSWTTMQGGNPLPGSHIQLNLGLPAQTTPETIAASHTDFFDPSSRAIYNDLGASGLGSIDITMAPNISGGSGNINWYTATMPFSFVAAFNQARLNGNRYLTIAMTLSDPMAYLVTLGSYQPSYSARLLVNTISTVPEPISWTTLAIGLSCLVIFQNRRQSQSQ